ncbi:hypothetical protein [Actinocrinis puniceicyclus]|nr:hypothetical protein [Actinocrinis puniceicyclus]
MGTQCLKLKTTAAVDRPLHRAHLVLASGDHRLARAMAGKGVAR